MDKMCFTIKEKENKSLETERNRANILRKKAEKLRVIAAAFSAGICLPLILKMFADAFNGVSIHKEALVIVAVSVLYFMVSMIALKYNTRYISVCNELKVSNKK